MAYLFERIDSDPDVFTCLLTVPTEKFTYYLFAQIQFQLLQPIARQNQLSSGNVNNSDQTQILILIFTQFTS
jgi:hypothetical protein